MPENPPLVKVPAFTVPEGDRVRLSPNPGSPTYTLLRSATYYYDGRPRLLEAAPGVVFLTQFIKTGIQAIPSGTDVYLADLRDWRGREKP